MNRKGFVFLETIVVLAVVALSLTMMLLTYTLQKSKEKEMEYYNKSSDLYALNMIHSIFKNVNENYTDTNQIFTINNCPSNYINNCETFFTDNNLIEYGIINDLSSELNKKINNSILKNSNNETIIYLKTLKRYNDKEKTKPIGYIYAVFKRNNIIYYSSVELEEEDENE